MQDEQPHPRLPLWQAGLFVMFAGVAAQLAGALASGVARVAFGTHGKPADALAPVVVLPAMLASSTALLTVALSVPRFMGVPSSVALGLRRAPPLCFAAA